MDLLNIFVGFIILAILIWILYGLIQICVFGSLNDPGLDVFRKGEIRRDFIREHQEELDKMSFREQLGFFDEHGV